MNTLIHTFDEDGYYNGSSEMPSFAAAPNPTCATLDPVPSFDPVTERARRVAGAWAVELIPLPEPPEPQFPRFYGNTKLDLFTPAEQLAVVEATMTDPMVKLMYDRFLGAAYLSYEDPEMEQVLSLLVDKGLITQERKLEIVSAMLPKP